MAATVPNLEQVFDAILERIQADTAIAAAGVPSISQLDPAYVAKYEAALRPAAEGMAGDGPGVVFVLWAASGRPNDGTDTPISSLWNDVLVGVVENKRNNTSGRTALGWVNPLLKILHNADRGAQRGRRSIRHPASGPAYELGALEHSLTP